MTTPGRRSHYTPRPQSRWQGKAALGATILLILTACAGSLSIILYYKAKADQAEAHSGIQKTVTPLLFHARQNLMRAGNLIRQKNSSPEEIRGLSVLALQSCEKVLAMDPENEEAWRLRGQGMENRYRFQEAQEAYSKAIELDQSSPANLLRGILGIRTLVQRKAGGQETGELQEKTREDFRRFVHSSQGDISDPQNRFLASLSIAWLLGENENVQILFRTAQTIAPAEWLPHLINGLSLSDQDKKPEALSAFQNASLRAPYLSEIHAFEGKLQQELHRPRKALEAFQLALSTNPRDLFARFARARILFSEGRYREARIDFQKYLQEAPQSFEALLQGALSGLRIWRPDLEDSREFLLELLEEFSLAIEGDATRKRALEGRAIAREMAGQYEESLEDLNLLLKETPGNRALLTQRARILTLLKKWDGAITDLSTLNNLRGRAWVLSHAGRTEEALKDLDQLQKTDPKDGSLYLLRAEIELQARQWDPALKTLLQLEEINPHLPRAKLLKAEAFLGKGDADETIDLMTRAFKEDPLFAEALVLRGKAWLLKERKDLAKKDFQAAISIDSRMKQKVPSDQTP